MFDYQLTISASLTFTAISSIIPSISYVYTGSSTQIFVSSHISNAPKTEVLPRMFDYKLTISASSTYTEISSIIPSVSYVYIGSSK